MIPSSTMPLGHSMNISTGILEVRYTASASHISEIHPSYLWYKFSTIIILVGVSVATGDNDSV